MRQQTIEEKVRLALGELGATWEDPELVISNILSIVEAEVERAVEAERQKILEVVRTWEAATDDGSNELDNLYVYLTPTKTDEQAKV